MDWYDTVLHALRHKFQLTHLEYCVINMVDKLSSHRSWSTGGWCRASSQTIANAQYISSKQVDRAISKAKKLGLIEVKKRAGTSTLKRCTLLWQDSMYNVKKSIDNKSIHPRQEVHTRIDNMSTDNNTSNNIDNNNTVHSSKKNELLESDFNALWDKYAHKVNKKAAMSAYKKLSKKQRKAALDGLANYEAVRKVTGVSKCHLSTYLNKQRWLDEMPIKTAKTKDLSNSTLNDVQVKAKIMVERLKNSPNFKELCKKVYSIANQKIRADKAKIESEALRFLKVFNVSVEDAVRDFDKLIQTKK